MSKQSEAKKRQNYIQKPTLRTCCNCKQYKNKIVTFYHSFGPPTQEKDIHCIVGDFAVKKMATCDLFSFR